MDQEASDEITISVEEVEYDALRPEAIDRAIQTLLEDSERFEGDLPRSEINRVYFRRKLSVAECGEVEKQLRQRGLNIVEDDESSQDEDEPVPDSPIWISRHRYLTPEQEVSCGRKIQFERLVLADPNIDPTFRKRVVAEADQARVDLLATNSRYVWKLAQKHARAVHLKREDLYQEGMIGVLRATETFDPGLGFRFKTYATWWVEQTMRRARANGDRTVRLPVHLIEKITRVRRAERKLTATLGRTPTVDEIAATLGCATATVAKLIFHQRQTDCIEADAPVGDHVSILALTADDFAVSGFDYVAENELKQKLQDMLMELSPREERVVRLRFGLDRGQEHTLEMIGCDFNLTRERIRQIEAKALRKLGRKDRKRILQHFIDS